MRPLPPPVRRSDLAGWAGYGYCATHSRLFWGLRLYLISTPAGLPVIWALADPKIGEREVMAVIVDDPDAVRRPARPDRSSPTRAAPVARPKSTYRPGVTLLRPSRKAAQPAPASTC